MADLNVARARACHRAVTATLAQILAAITTANRKLDVIMSQQDDLEAEIAKLKAANPAFDFAPLDAAAGSLKTMVATVAAIAPPPAAPAAPSA